VLLWLRCVGGRITAFKKKNFRKSLRTSFGVFPPLWLSAALAEVLMIYGAWQPALKLLSPWPKGDRSCFSETLVFKNQK